MLFGAGHVGKALVSVLSQLPCRVTWVDNREEQFPSNIETYHNIHKVVSEAPELEVASMPSNSYFVVMTHNHQMDFDITQAILKRSDFGYLGLIASDTKWRRFQQRYKHRDVDPKHVARMNCPIGLADGGGKLPMEVAVSVAAEIINTYQKEQTAQNDISERTSQNITDKSRPTSQQGIHWKEFKQLLVTE
jgi:xanthine dehydrogenase accessory factor